MKKLLSLLLVLLLLCGCSFPTETTHTPTQGQALTVHFIDVGQADCALLECGGEYILIDGGNVSDSSLVVSYLEKQGVTQLQAVIATHAHEDHAGGLPGVLAVFETKAVYAPTRTYASDCFDDFVHYTIQQGLEITIPSPGDRFTFGGATVTVLGPVKSYAETNDTSIVLMVQFGDTKFLFTGDMETTAENDMLDYWGESFDWHADVLKVGHHGSDTSTGYRFLRAVMPTYGVISVGQGNSYGHPCEGPLSKLRDAGVAIFRTDKLGTILATSDGKQVQVGCPSGGTPDLPAGTLGKTLYIGNSNSKKLHVEGCASLPKEENRTYFEDYDEAIAAGYTPCSKCMG
jgi:competence protein ComEC